MKARIIVEVTCGGCGAKGTGHVPLPTESTISASDVYLPEDWEENTEYISTRDGGEYETTFMCRRCK